MNKTRLIIIGGVLVILVSGIAQLLFPHNTLAPQSSTAEPSSTKNNATTSVQIQKSVATSSPSHVETVLPSIAKGDTIVSWEFVGAYTNNPELIAKAEAEIKRLSDLIGKGTYPNVTVYVSIAIQYDLLGEGKQEYDYLSRAIAAGPASGLPWHNLGVLMEKLGALKTAHVAYDRAVFLQPQFKEIQEP